MTLDEARTLYTNAVQSMHDAKVAEEKYNLAVAQLNRAAMCLPGYSVDIHGDGTVKPSNECSKPSP